MAARKESSGGSKPPPRDAATPATRPRRKVDPRAEPEDDAGEASWLSDDVSIPGRRAAEPTPARRATDVTPGASAVASARVPKVLSHSIAASAKAALTAREVEKARGAANAARILPPKHPTMEVQLEWLEGESPTMPKPRGEAHRTIPVELEWLEFVDDEPTTVARGRKTPQEPPPIPKPPPLPRESRALDETRDDDAAATKRAARASSPPKSVPPAKKKR